MPDTLLGTSAVLVTHRYLLDLKAELTRLRREASGWPTPVADDPGAALADPSDRIALLELALVRSVVAYPGPTGYTVAAVGTTVEVEDGRRTCRYRLVLGVEATDEGVDRAVSATSPVGAALMGRSVGEVAHVELPDGRERSLRVVRVDGPA
ncbi:GreA/GreB family elongation factor [Patulibacter sp. SYSU D01012]|uniref:GreA/GreB family elongation factor n=1 Tax=Patulibacter sp. SYSU D01012 TaxID=2817381 RepID=UPI001B30D121|nr:GreA/GreB family elongation factor [Patulibacter sp. SYSU D01012]